MNQVELGDATSYPMLDVGAVKPDGSYLPTSGRLMAIDMGEKRIGLALSDPSQSVAHPLTTLTRRSGKRFPMKQLRAHLEQHEPSGLVLGLPLAPDGSETEWTEEVRSVGSLIGEKTGLPVALWDERMTTARALSAIRDLGGGTKGRKGEIDKLAATVMLQAYLDSRTS